MIGTSFPEYLFIRTAIFLLHYFPPLVIVALVLILILDHSAHRLMFLLEVVSIAEVIFYVLVYIPKYRLLQKPAVHPPIGSYEERHRVFNKCAENITDPEKYMSKWFNEAPLATIKRENVKEFLCWALFNRAAWGPEEEEELNEYVDRYEVVLGKKLAAGRGSAVPLRLTIDPVNILYRPLLWYMIVALVDAITCLRLFYNGFGFYRLPLSRFLTVFPFRFITLTSFRTTPSNTLTYWYRPHTSKTHHPILFIHGIGIGLHTYVNLLASINKSQPSPSDGQIGIIAIEMMPVSFRLTGEIPSQDVLCAEIARILDFHGWNKFVLSAHSYGTVIAANLLKSRTTPPGGELSSSIPSAPTPASSISSRISSTLLIDPVVFLLHLPDVAYNFTRRPPRRANEHQLHYFASTDACVAHTLARHFFWAENILWKEDLAGKNISVALAGKDLIVDTKAVGRYLGEEEGGYERFLMVEDEDEVGVVDSTGNDVSGIETSGGKASTAFEDAWMERGWKGEGVDVLWFPRCDHASVFERKASYGRLVHVLRAYAADTETA